MRQHDWLVLPGARIGPVDAQTSERTLIEMLGPGQVVRRDAQVGEGMCAPGSVLYPGTPDSIEITWADSTFTKPAVVAVSGVGSRWSSPAGLRVGATLAELESLNAGQPIRFSGFGWDYGGTGSWVEGGVGGIMIGLAPDSASRDAASRDPRYREILGEDEVSSDRPLIRTMNIRVARVVIRWAEPNVVFTCKGI